MKKGFIAITTVLIISAVALSIGVTVSMLSIGEGQSSLALVKSEENFQLTQSCLEDVLFRLKNNTNFSGGNISNPDGNCNVSISNSGGQYTVTVIPNTTSYVRTVQIIINLTPSPVIISWQEI